jgi:hypothetical protein
MNIAKNTAWNVSPPPSTTTKRQNIGIFFFTNYDCINHACIRRKKKEMSEYGKELQDMSADAFSYIAVRGLRGSNAVHRKLKLMHKIEQEFNDLQELKGSKARSRKSTRTFH